MSSLVVFVTTFLTLIAVSRQIEHSKSSNIENSATTCQLPPKPKHGYYVVNTDPKAQPGDVAGAVALEVSCFPGYAVWGNRNPTCFQGVWREEIGVCKQCGRLPLPPQGQSGAENGTIANERIPWYAAIFRKTTTPYTLQCGGTLVSSKVVISAAHCFWDERLKKPRDPLDFTVQIGSSFRAYSPTDFEAQRSDVAEVKIPSSYEGSINWFQDDIALVALATSIEFKASVSPACLNFESNIGHNLEAVRKAHIGKVTGLSWSKKDGKVSPTLSTIGVPAVDGAQCIADLAKDIPQFVTPNMFCLDWTGFKNKTEDCLGSGISGAGILFPDVVGEDTVYYLRGVISSAPVPSDGSRSSPCLETFSTATHIIFHKKKFQEFVSK